MSLDTFTGAVFAGGVSSLLLSGINFSASQLTLPILYQLPAETSSRAFEELFHRGATYIIPLTLFSGLSTAFSAYLEPGKRRQLAFAAAVSVAPLAFTALFMRTGIQRLLNIAAAAAASGSLGQQKIDAKEVVGLLQRWRLGNNVRSALSATAGVTALAVLAGLL